MSQKTKPCIYSLLAYCCRLCMECLPPPMSLTSHVVWQGLAKMDVEGSRHNILSATPCEKTRKWLCKSIVEDIEVFMGLYSKCLSLQQIGYIVHNIYSNKVRPLLWHIKGKCTNLQWRFIVITYCFL